MTTVVFGSDPKNFGFNFISKKVKPYSLHTEKHTRFIWYKNTKIEIETVYRSLLRCEEEKIFLYDRILGCPHPINICDHINVSGENHLTGKTPFMSKPLFPDMSNVYLLGKNLPRKAVYTVGPKRFIRAKKTKKILSENAGNLASLFKYLGFKVFGTGIPKEMKRKRAFIQKQIKQMTTKLSLQHQPQEKHY